MARDEPCDKKNMQIRSGLRPWTFSASLIPVALGAVLSYKYTAVFNGTSAIILLLSVAAVVAVNSAGNMVNTYFDYMRSVKLRAGVTRDQAVLEEHLQLTQMVNGAAYLYGFAMICLWLLMWFSPAKSMHLAGLFFGGLSSSFIYTGGIGVKYYVLGDLLVIFTFGPLALLFSFVSQTGKLTFIPLLLALPLAVSTEAILHSKHAREMDADKKAGVLSLAILLGSQGSYFLYTVLLFVPYLVFFIWGLQYSLPLALPVLTIPFSFQLEKVFREGGPADTRISTGTAKLNLAMGLLFVVGCVLASRVPMMDRITGT